MIVLNEKTRWKKEFTNAVENNDIEKLRKIADPDVVENIDMYRKKVNLDDLKHGHYMAFKNKTNTRASRDLQNSIIHNFAGRNLMKKTVPKVAQVHHAINANKIMGLNKSKDYKQYLNSTVSDENKQKYRDIANDNFTRRENEEIDKILAKNNEGLKKLEDKAKLRKQQESNRTINKPPQQSQPSFFSKHKTALGIGAGALALGGAAYLYNRYKKKKEEEKNRDDEFRRV